MLSHGASPQNVMKMLGHTNIQQTMQYAAVLAKDVHADYAKIDEMFK
jgi:site-specific recombinase XerD